MFRKIICSIVVVAFLMSETIGVRAQMLSPLSTSNSLTFSEAFIPFQLKGLTLGSDPLNLEFIVDTGDDVVNSSDISELTARQIRYFLTAITIPSRDLWVNLSPAEQDRIIPDDLKSTEMGRVFLEEDLKLKELTARLLSPLSETGKLFWDKLYQALLDQGISTEQDFESFQKVWIVPREAGVLETGRTMFLVRGGLKIETDIDHMFSRSTGQRSVSDAERAFVSVFRQNILPLIEKDINESRDFAPLRQVYSALVLAAWYKSALKGHWLDQEYVGQDKSAGLTREDGISREEIYQQYLSIFLSENNHLVQEEYDPQEQKTVVRQYVTGGIAAGQTSYAPQAFDAAQLNESFSPDGQRLVIPVNLQNISEQASVHESDRAMLGDGWESYSYEEIDAARQEYLEILEQPSAVDILEKRYEPILKEYLLTTKLFVSSDFNSEGYDQWVREQVDEFKKRDIESYRRTLAGIVFVAEFLDIGFRNKCFGKMDFMSKHNPLYDDKAFEYFVFVKGLEYSPSKDSGYVKLHDEINNSFHFTAEWVNTFGTAALSERLSANQVMVEPTLSTIAYRIMQKDDPKIWKIWADDIVSQQTPWHQWYVEGILEIIAWAVSHDVEPIEDFMAAVIPALKSSRLNLKDVFFIEKNISHLLNSKNFYKYRFMILKLLDVVPSQKRLLKQNKLRITLMRIDDSHGPKGHRQFTVFRYLRVHFHKDPTSNFINLMKDFIGSILENRVYDFLDKTMKPEAKELFLTEPERQRFVRWSQELPKILSLLQKYQFENFYQFLDAEDDVISQVLTDSGIGEGERDWKDLSDIWKAAQSTYGGFKGGEEKGLKDLSIYRKELFYKIVEDSLPIGTAENLDINAMYNHDLGLIFDICSREQVDFVKGFWSLSKEQMNRLLKQAELGGRLNYWQRLIDIWIESRKTEFLSFTNLDELDELNRGADVVFADQDYFWKMLLNPLTHMDIYTKYYSRRHMGFFSGYTDYIGVDPYYSEKKYDWYLHYGTQSRQIMEVLNDVLDSIKKSPSPDLYKNIAAAKFVLAQAVQQMQHRGLARKRLVTEAEMLSGDLNGYQLKGVVQHIRQEILYILDFFNERFRPAVDSLTNYYSPFRVQKDYFVQKDGDKEAVEEKIMGGLLADEVAFDIAKRALELLESYVAGVNGKDREKDIVSERPLQLEMLSSGNILPPGLFGSKFSNLSIAKTLGIKIPPAGVLSAISFKQARQQMRGLKQRIRNMVKKLEQESGKFFPGDVSKLSTDDKLLLLSVRSGSFESLPGLMDTISNVPMSDEIVDFMLRQAKDDEDRKFVWDTYRRFLDTYAVNALYMKESVFVDKIDRLKEREDIESEALFEGGRFQDLKELAGDYKQLIAQTQATIQRVLRFYQIDPIAHLSDIKRLLNGLNDVMDLDKAFGREGVAQYLSGESQEVTDEIFEGLLPEAMDILDLAYRSVRFSQSGEETRLSANPYDVLLMSVLTVYRSWGAPAAVRERERFGISHAWGTAVGLQEMRFGNSSEDSGTAVVFTHDALTGQRRLNGSFKPAAQGEDLVAGRSGNVMNLEVFGEQHWNVLRKISTIARAVLREFRLPQDMEFTWDEEAVWALQTRDMQLVEAQSWIEPSIGNGDYPLIASGDGETGVAKSVRLLVMDDNPQEALEDVRRLRQQMDVAGERDIGIVLVSHYLLPQHAALMSYPEVDGMICSIKGGSSHGTLNARRHKKVLISGVESLREEDGLIYFGWQSFEQGMQGQIFTLDSNGHGVKPHGGKIFLGRLPIKDRNGDHAMLTNTVQENLVVQNGGVDFDLDRFHLKRPLGSASEIKFRQASASPVRILGLKPMIGEIRPMPAVESYVQ